MQSMHDFLAGLFPDKPKDKVKLWSDYLLEQEYENPQDLAELEESQWESLRAKIPAKIAQDIKKKLKKPTEVVPVVQTPSTIVSDQEFQNVRQLLENEVSIEVIAKMIKAPPDSPKWKDLISRINYLKGEKKPFPDSKRIPARKGKEKDLAMFLYPARQIAGRHYFTFLVVGQTGSGKTTLLDAFTNCISKINIRDQWRYKLVDESIFNDLDDDISKTNDINIYYINDPDNKFNVRIIDTPGFGDTRGIKADDRIVQKFQQIFRTLPQIDYILLTVKASETRRKLGSLYIYDRVQQLFGKDAKERFILMCTFADGGDPQCLKFIGKQITFSKYFMFNNSALFSPKVDEPNIRSFWKMGNQNIRTFQDFVVNSNLEPLSLSLSSQVLQNRRYIIAQIETSQQKLNQTWEELDVCKQNVEQFEKNRKKVESNQVFQCEVIKYRDEVKKLDKAIQYCTICNKTCCSSCAWPQGAPESHCTFFKRGNCPCCNQCPKSSHRRYDCEVVKVSYKEKVIEDYKKRALDEGLSGAEMYKKLIIQKLQRVESLSFQVWQLSNLIKERIKELQKTALKPKIFSDKEFYQQMITEIEEKKETGWTNKVEAIKQVLKSMDALDRISGSLTIEDLLPDYAKIKQKYSSQSEKNCCIF